MAVVAQYIDNNLFVVTQRPISLEEFEQEFESKEDDYKYEWVDGFVEKSKRTMNQDQFYIMANLRDLFFRLRIDRKVNGYLETEFSTFLSEQTKRIPDIAYYSQTQFEGMKKGKNQIPEFLIEVISKTDNINRVGRKIQNYREAGVKVVWHIFPEINEVHVYHGENMTIMEGDKICSAAPVLPDFQISVNDLLMK